MIAAFIVAAADAVTTHEEKSGGGLPQLNPADFSPQLVWLAITFAVLYLILARVALPRIGEVIEERKDRVQRDLDAAERFKAETDAALAAYEKALNDAAPEGVVHGQGHARHAHRRDRQGARRRSRAQLSAKLAEAEARIAATKSQGARPASTRSPPRRRRRSSASCSARTSAPPRSRRCFNPPPSEDGMLFDPADPVFWVMIAFFAFIGLLIYYRVPGHDDEGAGCARRRHPQGARRSTPPARRGAGPARRLQAQEPGSRERDQGDLEQAKREAEALAAETRKSLSETVERRTQVWPRRRSPAPRRRP